MPQQNISSAAQAAALASEPLEITALLINLAIGVVLAMITRWHFKQFGSTLTNREEFTRVIPFVMLTTILIISVVKSSLALSLGLVGALSIVRFRTPIKEPEELAYLFLALALGVGLGANQRMPSIVAGLVILAVMAAIAVSRRASTSKNLFLSVDMAGETPDDSLERLNTIIGRHAADCDLRRFDIREQALEATYFVDMPSTAGLSVLSQDLRREFPAIGVTFLDQNRLPSV